MEQPANLNFEFLEDTKGHAAARSGGGLLRWVGSVKPSLCLKLLGISLVAQQFTTASAESICHAFASVEKRFDMIGLISALGTAAATKSLSYSALNDSGFYLTGHVGPGSLNVAAVLFEATKIRVARLLAFGGAGDTCDLVQLDCPGGLRYIGLKSNTECPVLNAVGASIVREHQSLWKDHQRKELSGLMEGSKHGNEDIFGRRVGRDAKREVKVITLKVRKTEEERDAWRTQEIRVSLKASRRGALLLGWLPLLLTFGVVVSCWKCKQWFVAGFIILGTFGLMIAVMGLRLCLFGYSKPQVAKAAPKGDCLVVDDTDSDILHIIEGEEESIQALFQRKIVDYQPPHGCKYLLLLAGSMLYVYVVASVLSMPNVSTSGQIHFAIANLIGLVADLVKASHNGKLGLAKKARETFKIEAKDLVVFQNRTSAVAFVAKHAKDRSMLKSKKLLPCDGPVWQKWWDELAKRDNGEVQVISNKSIAATADQEDQELLKTLLDDMTEGLDA